MPTPTPPQPLQPIPSAPSILPNTRALIAQYLTTHSTLAQIITPSTATFTNTIHHLAQADQASDAFAALISCLWYCSPSEEVRTAAQEARKLWREAETSVVSRSDVFALIQAVHDREGDDLVGEDKRLLVDMLGDYTDIGHGVLNEEEREELRKSWLEVGDLIEEFTGNLAQEKGGMWFSEEELEGVKKDKVGSFRLGGKGDGEGEGNRWVSFQRGDHAAVMKFAERRETRKKYMDGADRRLPENVPIFRRVFEMRDGNARRLGYGSHAEYRLRGRMAGSPGWVEGFNASLNEGLGPFVERDLERRRACRRRHLERNPRFGGEGDEVPPEDRAYYRRLAEEEDRIDHEVISEWFPLEYTIRAMLRMFSAFLGIVFVAVPKEELDGKVWHEEVDVFSVWEEGEGNAVGEFIGYLYTDLLFRDGKYRGNQNCPLQSGHEKPDGTRSYPATVLMCSTPRTTSAPCPLLKHSEVVTIFHELGHGIHDLVSRTKYRRFHSWSGPQRDFCEGPSMFLESFCWLPSELREMSCHYTQLPSHPDYLSQWREKTPGKEDPAEKIPTEMVDDLVRRRYFDQGYWWADQLGISIFDMRVTNPSSREELLALDFAELYSDIYRELIPWKRKETNEPKGNSHVHFPHIIHGMDAGYYAYLWAGVFAADVFDRAFAANPRDGKTWERYRRVILQPGGSTDAKQMVEEFLGRPVNPEALFRRLRMAD
ncbi:peptidase family M3 [Lasiosphaeria hispida]|uniref:Peptidase family M3 n=1 Tax=Lasiosphaeria hispida TaxID=260671 RepID=A0AAJ0HF61_9PEZI|nr:peptidase family M3 [Lasiosphaeria hispida]